MKQDRFLLGILIFIGVLVLLALGLFFLRNETPEYGPEDTPQGVVANYIIALDRREYERAYTYLAEGDYKPSYAAFLNAFRSQQLGDPGTSLQIGEVEMPSGNEAWVSINMIYPGNGLFDSGWTNTDRASLVLQEGAWKITYLPYPWWGWDWYTPTLEPAKP
jgi:hypothetical protein